MKRHLIGLAAVLVVTGCVSARPLTLPDGQQGQVVKCPGAIRTIADCNQKAGEVCPFGYDVIGADGSVTPMAFSQGSASASAYGGNAQFSGFSGSVVSRSLMVRCHVKPS